MSTELPNQNDVTSLDDKYTIEKGPAYMSGIQALVKLPILQQAIDAKNGLNTGGFISGYRGSPLGAYDQALWQAKKYLEPKNIVFQPGVNEELGATAVWGSQQIDLYPDQKKLDGVFGIWYGKGPGVDRCSDVFKHANMAGTAQHGGVIAIAGDDHIAKSSSVAHQSDHIFKACGLPVFFPSNVQEILDFGLHAIALSRYSGLWAGFKVIQEVVESSSSVEIDPDRVKVVIPTDFKMPEGGVHIRWPDTPLAQEARLMDFKWYAALAYIRANKLNHTVLDSDDAKLGLISSGKAFNDTRQALHDLGLDDSLCRQLGIRIHKVGVVWPLEAHGTREFATGLDEILVIEEKRQMIEYQIKEQLYNWREDVRPNVLGKFSEPEGDQTGGEWSYDNPTSQWLLRAKADLNPAIIAQAIAQRLDKLGLLSRVSQEVRDRIQSRLKEISDKEAAIQAAPAGADRQPWFCSGCPHNTSTRVPEGSRAMAGIGCHYMVQWMDRNTDTFTQMGGEGVTWVGQAPFTKEKHVFVNLGDGTYFHSGLLAIRQSIAAKVNITYKILYNDAVAMTGGQPIDGTLSVSAMVKELEAEGANCVVVVSDHPEVHRDNVELNVTNIYHRDQLDEVQKMLRNIPGCTILIYEQTCATEKRRRRKRGTMPESKTHVVINEAVCEGCGDCGVQSNCLSVEPVETEFGTKRRINQSTCNQDMSCVKGFCPSLVTVKDGVLRKPSKESADIKQLGEPPEPIIPNCDKAYGIVIAGIGGTGVITVGQLLGMAAHIDGKGVIAQEAAGLAQKGGATWSHVQIANKRESIHTTKVGMAMADLIFGCDPIVATNAATTSLMNMTSTVVVLNSHKTPTAGMLKNSEWSFPVAQCDSALDASVAKQNQLRFEATEMSQKLLGDTIYSNAIMMGFAWQKGLIPLSLASLRRAIELNGAQVAKNLEAFEWGRHYAHNPSSISRIMTPAVPVTIVRKAKANFWDDEKTKTRVEYLTAYQDSAYASRYDALVRLIRMAEAQVSQSNQLTAIVAEQLFRLMAYKDEYEVARLMTDPKFTEQIGKQFEGDWRIEFNFAPPLITKTKMKFGQHWMPALKVLARMKFLRGTMFDPLGYTADRKEDRETLEQFTDMVKVISGSLRSDNYDLACQILGEAAKIKGYGHVRHNNLKVVQMVWEKLWPTWK